MKITEIVRSFSKTFQEEKFEPFSVFASYKAELEGDESPKEIKETSEKLYELAQKDVRTITDMWTNKRAALKRKREEAELNKSPWK